MGRAGRWATGVMGWILRTFAQLLLFLGGCVISLAIMIAAFPLVDSAFYDPFPFRYGPRPDYLNHLFAAAVAGTIGMGLVIIGLRLLPVWKMKLAPSFNRIFYLPYT